MNQAINVIIRTDVGKKYIDTLGIAGRGRNAGRPASLGQERE